MAQLYKDGVMIHNTIDNDGVSDQASLGARYAKGRLDSTANDLDLNYFTKEEVYDLLDGIAKTYIVSQPPTTPYFLLSEDATAVSTKEYWTVTFVQDTDPISSEMMFLYERKAFIPSWDTEPHIYYELADPTSWDPGTKTYYKVDTETQRTFTPGEAIAEVVYTKEPRYPEPNTYYLVGNDTDGYILYYFDSELEEAVIGSYTLDLSDYQKKFEYDPSLIGGLTDESTFSDVNLTATPTPLISKIKAWVVWNYVKFKAKGGISTALENNFTLGRALVSDDYGKIAVANTTKAEIERLRGVTSGVQAQLDAKQAKITGAATTITGSNLTANRALISNGSGKVAVSSVTSTELGYLSGVTSALQTQINNKQNKNWTYVGILEAGRGSSITVGDDWDELNLVMRVSEGNSKYNLGNIKTKNDFTIGSPTNNTTFVGFYWNATYYCNRRLGLSGSGTSRKLNVNWVEENGWTLNGFYIYKR